MSDVFGNRIAEELRGVKTSAGNKSTYYVNEDGHAVLQFNKAKQLEGRKLYGPAVDQILANDEVLTGTTSWALADRQGTVRDVIYRSGGELWTEHLTYDAFGKPDWNVGESIDHARKMDAFYAGRPFDWETHFVYMRARNLDTDNGRMNGEDDIGLLSGDTNFYRYCFNSPINYTDPSGCVANVVVGAGIGGVLGAGAYLYQYTTGNINEFSWTDLGIYTAGGMAAGAVAGATFGLSLAAGSTVAGAFGLTGTAGAVTTASIGLGLTGAAAGTAGGFVTGAGLTASHGGSAGQIVMGGLAGAGRGAFYGGISGAAAGAVLPFTAAAGLWFGGGALGGGIALGSSFAVGDVVAQGLGLAVGLQDRYSLSQTIFAGAMGFLPGAYAGYRDPRLGIFASGFRSLLPPGPALTRGAQLRAKYSEVFDEYMHFRNQGFTPAQSKYLTEPYNGRGHHFPISQATADNLNLAITLRDGPFNVLRPSGMSRGRFYELHYQSDPSFFTANFPARIRGTWNGANIGLPKFGPWARAWYATPPALKAAGATAIVGGGAAGVYWLFGNGGEE